MLPLLTSGSSPYPKTVAYSISVSCRLSWLGFKSVFNNLNQEFSLNSHSLWPVGSSIQQWSPRLSKHCLHGAGIIFKWPPFTGEHSVNHEQTIACALLEQRDPNSALDINGTPQQQQKSALKLQFHHSVEGWLLQHTTVYMKAGSLNLKQF